MASPIATATTREDERSQAGAARIRSDLGSDAVGGASKADDPFAPQSQPKPTSAPTHPSSITNLQDVPVSKSDQLSKGIYEEDNGASANFATDAADRTSSTVVPGPWERPGPGLGLNDKTAMQKGKDSIADPGDAVHPAEEGWVQPSTGFEGASWSINPGREALSATLPARTSTSAYGRESRSKQSRLEKDRSSSKQKVPSTHLHSGSRSSGSRNAPLLSERDSFFATHYLPEGGSSPPEAELPKLAGSAAKTPEESSTLGQRKQGDQGFSADVITSDSSVDTDISEGTLTHPHSGLTSAKLDSDVDSFTEGVVTPTPGSPSRCCQQKPERVRLNKERLAIQAGRGEEEDLNATPRAPGTSERRRPPAKEAEDKEEFRRGRTQQQRSNISALSMSLSNYREFVGVDLEEEDSASQAPTPRARSVACAEVSAATLSQLEQQQHHHHHQQQQLPHHTPRNQHNHYRRQSNFSSHPTSQSHSRLPLNFSPGPAKTTTHLDTASAGVGGTSRPADSSVVSSGLSYSPTALLTSAPYDAIAGDSIDSNGASHAEAPHSVKDMTVNDENGSARTSISSVPGNRNSLGSLLQLQLQLQQSSSDPHAAVDPRFAASTTASSYTDLSAALPAFAAESTPSLPPLSREMSSSSALSLQPASRQSRRGSSHHDRSSRQHEPRDHDSESRSRPHLSSRHSHSQHRHHLPHGCVDKSIQASLTTAEQQPSARSRKSSHYMGLFKENAAAAAAKAADKEKKRGSGKRSRSQKDKERTKEKETGGVARKEKKLVPPESVSPFALAQGATVAEPSLPPNAATRGEAMSPERVKEVKGDGEGMTKVRSRGEVPVIHEAAEPEEEEVVRGTAAQGQAQDHAEPPQFFSGTFNVAKAATQNTSSEASSIAQSPLTSAVDVGRPAMVETLSIDQEVVRGRRQTAQETSSALGSMPEKDGERSGGDLLFDPSMARVAISPASGQRAAEASLDTYARVPEEEKEQEEEGEEEEEEEGQEGEEQISSAVYFPHQRPEAAERELEREEREARGREGTPDLDDKERASGMDIVPEEPIAEEEGPLVSDSSKSVESGEEGMAYDEVVPHQEPRSRKTSQMQLVMNDKESIPVEEFQPQTPGIPLEVDSGLPAAISGLGLPTAAKAENQVDISLFSQGDEKVLHGRLPLPPPESAPPDARPLPPIPSDAGEPVIEEYEHDQSLEERERRLRRWSHSVNKSGVTSYSTPLYTPTTEYGAGPSSAASVSSTVSESDFGFSADESADDDVQERAREAASAYESVNVTPTPMRETDVPPWFGFDEQQQRQQPQAQSDASKLSNVAIGAMPLDQATHSHHPANVQKAP
ncbi:hypothetical protein KEM55_006995, partial [Ascosphaera atra]